MLALRDVHEGRRRQPSFNARALDLASDLGDNRYVPDAHINTVPASLATQMGMQHLAQHMERRRRERDSGEERRSREEQREEAGLLNRVMMARMNTLEEGFREVLQEVRGLASHQGSKAVSAVGEGSQGGQRRSREKKRRGGRKGEGMEGRRERSATPWFREPEERKGDADVGAEAERVSV